jgi:hypothetical protein
MATDVDVEGQFVTDGKARISSKDPHNRSFDRNCSWGLKVAYEAGEFNLDMKSRTASGAQKSDVGNRHAIFLCL